MSGRTLAIVNPAAGGGRCGRAAPAVLDGLRAAGVALDVVHTSRPGEATTFARDGYRDGHRHFVAVGGDGTSHEIANGLAPVANPDDPAFLGFLPLGTGNSFLRDFTDRGAEQAREALLARRARPVDLVRLVHDDGELWSINILSIGFVADICVTANRRFKALGAASYALGVFAELASLEPAPIPHRIDDGEWDREPVTFLSFNNSQYTGGTMHMAPHARTDDGLAAYVRCAPMTRGELVRAFPAIYRGRHVANPKIRTTNVARVVFDVAKPVDVMVDGEVITVRPRSLDVVPGRLQVFV